ncbi:hypothetical protein K431DRAFT_239821 [Polychaeton citri CBS 116435]|uniref:Glucosidase 2 subunit beta n=1 Tax=Polychaeton citri CBS 116435 TaxID=1314669 RepID=A0A9P4QD02_9PEZI|nr:hypothetical protein K431DRAFT_239821 [Polychaeton citri CBS 116435]
MKAVAAISGLQLVSVALAESRPRGVGPEFAKFYKDVTSFSCINNPDIKLPFARVNDDYCDCPDGSDEPGTSACSHLSPLSPHTPADFPAGVSTNSTLALPGFYCKNKGHIPAYVPYTAVNDGVCDYNVCCDGSEEYASIGGHKCEDKCKEIGKEWRKHDEMRQKMQGNADKKRKELVKEAARLRKEVEDRLQTLGTQIEGSKKQVAALEIELVEIERKEKGKVVKTVGEGTGKIGQLVALGKQRTQELRDSLVRVRGERDTASSRLKELEQILSTFKVEYNPNFNDEGVKRAVRAWEDYAARDKGPEPNSAQDRDLDEISKPDADSGLDWDAYQDEEGTDTDVLYEFENYLPTSLRSFVDQKLRDFRLFLIDNGILAEPQSISESKLVQDARKRVETARKDLNNLEKDLNGRKDDLQRDFGPDDVFRALKDQCVSTDSGEYTYEVCFLERTNQKSKKGGGNTNMGNFVRFETLVVDEDVPADGKGLGSGERLAMRYENGQHCWNGPNRSTLVVLACAEENEIWKVMEEEKCVYRMEVGTPAVCHSKASGKVESAAKDEL